MYKSIQPKSAHDMIKQDTVTIIDIRDIASFEQDHLENARHVTGENIEEFVEASKWNQPLLVYCYHGNSSQPAAEYFGNRGFEDVYHLVGGFESWRSSNLPTACSTN
jgi:thiosulfate sulfurtransferase